MTTAPRCASSRHAVVRSAVPVTLAAAFLFIALAPRFSVLAADRADPRLRTVLYSADEIYRLPGRVGYQIDLEFEPGESFVGLGAGDVQGLSFAAEGNHLFLKPRASSVHTNLTVVTSRRIYHFDYATVPAQSDPDGADVLYALRFAYARAQPAAPAPPTAGPKGASAALALLAQTSAVGARNTDYWYCGRSELQPVAAWDDGVHTHLRFSARSELPAVFVRNDDGSESLVNFNVEHDEIVLHRIAHRWVLRRGQLVGCILNKGFLGSGAALPLGTVSPEVERRTRSVGDAAVP